MAQFLVPILMALAILGAAQAQAQTTEELRDRVNRGTVGIVTGGVNGTYIRIGADLAAVLDAEDLRILAILGKGSVQNVADLLYLRGMDVAIVQSDVLEFLRQQGVYANIANRVHYITKLYNEEFHLLARPGINSIAELQGRTVNVDSKGSGTAMTTTVIFDVLGIQVETTHHDQSLALEQLRNGQIDALVYVAGKPTTLFKDIATGSGLHFLPIDYTPRLMETYLPARLGSADYPGLIPAGETVNTVAVGAVLAVYSWNPGQGRYAKVARFVNRFFENFQTFQQPSRHPKWREVSLPAVVPGWTRFRAAQQWLDAVAPAPSGQ